jgi:hypothetical protein
MTRRGALRVIGAGVAGTVAGTGTVVADQTQPIEKQLAEVRQATVQFRDPNLSTDKSQIVDDEGKVLFKRLGAFLHGMGEHYINKGFQWDLDIREPTLITFGYTDDDDLLLGAIEWLGGRYPEQSTPPNDVFGHQRELEAWGVDTGVHPPTDLDDNEDGDISDGEITEGRPWVLHTWPHTANSDGVFDQLNCKKQFHQVADFYEPDEEKTTIVSPQNEIGADNRITYSGEGCKNL